MKDGTYPLGKVYAVEVLLGRVKWSKDIIGMSLNFPVCVSTQVQQV